MSLVFKNNKRPVVLFTITNGWAIRNFLYTGVLDMVSQSADIGIATSQDLLPFFRDLQSQGRVAFVVGLPSQEPMFWQKIRQIKKAILQAKFDISTAKIKWCQRMQGALGQACLAVLWSVQRMVVAHWQLRVLESLENRLATRKFPPQLMQSSVMVNCAPFDFRDNQLQRTLYRNGVRSISIIQSWDNPSTKGCIFSHADLVLVWGRNQKNELLNYYPHIDPGHIRISGIPQFDSYYQQLSDEFSRKLFFKRLAIAPDSRVILYATCSERLFPDEPVVVADLADALMQGYFGSNTHLLIRCHPADRAERYQHLCSNDRVTIVPSSVGKSENLYTWIPPDDEVAILAATLRHCDVCINTASTMTLDAFACGKPVVNVAYDGKNSLPYLQSVRRFYDYHHYLPITRSGAVPIVRSAGEMCSAIEEAITSPQRLQPKRDAVVNNFCFHPTEGSVEFIVREIKKLV
ncbi:MAG: hypothetical protein GXP08_11500 [Gammaproteobacteria bacterium]|nr:hypothetical protein [Gammaproteobacteria bacterium]